MLIEDVSDVGHKGFECFKFRRKIKAQQLNNGFVCNNELLLLQRGEEELDRGMGKNLTKAIIKSIMT